MVEILQRRAPQVPEAQHVLEVINELELTRDMFCDIGIADMLVGVDVYGARQITNRRDEFNLDEESLNALWTHSRLLGSDYWFLAQLDSLPQVGFWVPRVPPFWIKDTETTDRGILERFYDPEDNRLGKMRSITAQMPLTTQFLVQRLRLNNGLRPGLAEEHFEQMEEFVKLQGATHWMILDDDTHYPGQRQLNIFPLPRGSVTTAFESLAYPGYVHESVARESVWDEGDDRARLEKFTMDQLRAYAASMEMEKKEEILAPGHRRCALSEQALQDLEDLGYSREELQANAADATSLGRSPNTDANSISDSNAETGTQHSVASEDAESESEAASDAPSEDSASDDEDDASVSEDRHSPQIAMNAGTEGASDAASDASAGNDEDKSSLLENRRRPQTTIEAGSDTGFNAGSRPATGPFAFGPPGWSSLGGFPGYPPGFPPDAYAILEEADTIHNQIDFNNYVTLTMSGYIQGYVDRQRMLSPMQPPANPPAVAETHTDDGNAVREEDDDEEGVFDDFCPGVGYAGNFYGMSDDDDDFDMPDLIDFNGDYGCQSDQVLDEMELCD